MDRYELGTPLGAGGQGRTFRARDRQTGHEVAVKVIQLTGADGWKAFDLFERECQVLRSLDHPGIPKYLDTFAREEEGRFFLVMELVEGESLLQSMRSGGVLSQGEVWSILHQSLDILGYLHGRMPPVIHRDIKPANLIRRPDGRLCLVDFGGVRRALRPEGGSTVVGTFGFMAPEQLHGEAVPATDLYGLGATLATVATGTEADKLPRAGLKIDLDAVMPPSTLRDLLQQLLEPDPSERLGSVAAVRQQLARASADRSGRRDASELEEDEEDEEPDTREREIDFPLSILLRIVGLAGYLGLVVLDAVLLPVIFALLGSTLLSAPRHRPRLREAEKGLRRALGSGRRAMKALARGRDPYRDRMSPPRLPPRSDRGLPPARRQNVRGRGPGRRRGRGRRGQRR
jgi:serine/threonine protein kinase